MAGKKEPEKKLSVTLPVTLYDEIETISDVQTALSKGGGGKSVPLYRVVRAALTDYIEKVNADPAYLEGLREHVEGKERNAAALRARLNRLGGSTPTNTDAPTDDDNGSFSDLQGMP